jgi:hypothetical protein
MNSEGKLVEKKSSEKISIKKKGRRTKFGKEKIDEFAFIFEITTVEFMIFWHIKDTEKVSNCNYFVILKQVR